LISKSKKEPRKGHYWRIHDRGKRSDRPVSFVKAIPSIRRVVRTPKRWERIVELADERGFKLPPDPDAKALDEFLMKEKKPIL